MQRGCKTGLASPGSLISISGKPLGAKTLNFCIEFCLDSPSAGCFWMLWQKWMFRQDMKRKGVIKNSGPVWTEISMHRSSLKKGLENILGSVVTRWKKGLLMAWTRLKTIQQKWPKQTAWKCQSCEDPSWHDDRREAWRRSQSQYGILIVIPATCL